MDANRWQRVRAIFDTVADADPDTWDSMLAAACADAPDLREDVRRLLAQQTRAPHPANFYLDRVRAAQPQHPVLALIEGPRFDRDKARTLIESKTTAVQTRSPEVVAALVVVDRGEDDGRAKVEAELGGAPLHALFTAQELLAL